MSNSIPPRAGATTPEYDPNVKCWCGIPRGAHGMAHPWATERPRSKVLACGKPVNASEHLCVRLEGHAGDCFNLCAPAVPSGEQWAPELCAKGATNE
jgi:hypothetical protein